MIAGILLAGLYSGASGEGAPPAFAPSRTRLMNFAIANPSDFHRQLAAQVGTQGRIDVRHAMQTFEAQLRSRLGSGVSVDVECPRGNSGLWCRSDGFVDLILALFVWARQRYRAAPTSGTKIKFRVLRRGPEVEIAIWEQNPRPPCIRTLTLWSQLCARIEQLGGRMQVEPERMSQGQWRHLWIEAL